MNNLFATVAKAVVDGPTVKLGENGHSQFTVTGAVKPINNNSANDKQEIKNRIVALNFVLVRGVTPETIEKSISDIVSLMNKPGFENDLEIKELTVKLFCLAAYQRDIDGGKGERDIFYNIVFHLYKSFPIGVEVLLRTILPTDHACWKDVLRMIELLDSAGNPRDIWRRRLENYLTYTFTRALKADKDSMDNGGKPSLACKWAPRQQSHFDKAPLGLAKRFAHSLFPEHTNIATRMKHYRKFLSSATEASATVEHLMCSGQWEKINPGAVPSRAMKIYRNVFQNKTKKGEKRSDDPKRIALSQRLIEFVSSGKAVHGKTLMVHELIMKLMKGPDDVLEAQLKSIVEDFRAAFPSEIGLVLPLADVSGSMGQAINGTKARLIHVSIALGFLLSQVDGPFKDKVMTFHEDPRIVDISSHKTLYDKVKAIVNMPWSGSTNFGKAMDYLLHSLKTNGVSGDGIAALNLIVFSDMQFNAADCSREVGGYYKGGTGNNWAVAQQRIEAMYKKEGFPVPRIIYWNLNARDSDALPAHTQDKNVVLLSGFNQSALKTFLKGNILPTIENGQEVQKTPWEVLDATFANYVWLMTAFEESGIFPGYKAPIVEENSDDDEETNNTGGGGGAGAAAAAAAADWEDIE